MSTTDRNVIGDVRSESDAKQAGASDAQLWISKIEKQKTESKREKWFKDAKLAVAAYEDGEEIVDERKISGANLFHAGVEVITPSVYSSTPIPDIRVRNNKLDPVAKAACDLYEAVVSYDLDDGVFDAVMTDGVRKSKTVGEGMARVRYRAHMVSVPVPHPDGKGLLLDEAGKPVTREIVAEDEVYTEIVPWDRVILGPGRYWSKIDWIAFEHDMTEDEVKKLNPEVAKKISFGDGRSRVYGKTKRDAATNPEKEEAGILATVTVFEVWDRVRRLIWWITDAGDDQLIAIHPDPYKLRQFYPMPHPLRPKSRFDSQLPVVPYASSRRLYDRFENVWSRIAALVDQAKVKGLYDARLGPDVQKLATATDGQYFEAKNGDQFGPNEGGLAKSIAHWPLEQIVAAINVLVPQLERIKAMIWEADGVSDIMRGATDPNETLGAQELKSQYGSMRLKAYQGATAVYARDLIRIMVEIRANLTPWNILKELSGNTFAPTPEMQQQAMEQATAELAPPAQQGMPAQQPDPQHVQQRAEQIAADLAQQFEQAVQQVAKNPKRHILIDVETNSTIRGEVSRDMEQFNQLIAATSQFAASVGGLAPVMPHAVPPLFKVFCSQVRKFRLGKEGEAALDELAEQAQQPPQPEGQQQASPEQMQAQQDERQHQADMADRAAAAKQAETEGKLALGDQKLRTEQVRAASAERQARLGMMADEVGFDRDMARARAGMGIAGRQQSTEIRGGTPPR